MWVVRVYETGPINLDDCNDYREEHINVVGPFNTENEADEWAKKQTEKINEVKRFSVWYSIEEMVEPYE